MESTNEPVKVRKERFRVHQRNQRGAETKRMSWTELRLQRFARTLHGKRGNNEMKEKQSRLKESSARINNTTTRNHKKNLKKKKKNLKKKKKKIDDSITTASQPPLKSAASSRCTATRQTCACSKRIRTKTWRKKRGTEEERYRLLRRKFRTQTCEKRQFRERFK